MLAAPSVALAAPFVALALGGCPQDEIVAEGEYGRPIALASGDASDLPRLAVRLDGCRGAAGGCASVCTGPPGECPADACLPLLVDSGTPLTMLAGEGALSAERACFEVRAADELLTDPPAEGALAAAIARFRLDSVPLLRLPRDAADLAWRWQIGDQDAAPHVGGVLGGNALRQFAVRFTDARGSAGATVTLYREFPGSESILADQGSSALPLQFPGLLLGKTIDDVCVLGDDGCDFTSLGVFDRNRPESALQPTRLVLDACLASPPATAVLDPDNQRRCLLSPGPGSRASRYRSPTGASGLDAAEASGCGVAATSLPAGDIDVGHEASLVVATGLPGLVLFEDSARRMFNDLNLPSCAGGGGMQSGDPLSVPACIVGRDGLLRAPGWPDAGTAEAPLLQLRVRSVGLVPGLAQSTGPSACQRLEVRLKALKSQCDRARTTRVPRDVSENCRAAASAPAVVLGQAFVPRKQSVDPSRWIPALVVPADHSLVTSLRRDVSPEALQPDGLLGSALLRGTDVVLDYTDPTPSVRVACLDPDDGSCLSMPSCNANDDPSAVVPACCFGLPEDLLVAMIRDDGAYGCCAALAPTTVEELNNQAAIEGLELPCPDPGV